VTAPVYFEHPGTATDKGASRGQDPRVFPKLPVFRGGEEPLVPAVVGKKDLSI